MLTGINSLYEGLVHSLLYSWHNCWYTLRSYFSALPFSIMFIYFIVCEVSVQWLEDGRQLQLEFICKFEKGNQHSKW